MNKKTTLIVALSALMLISGVLFHNTSKTIFSKSSLSLLIENIEALTGTRDDPGWYEVNVVHTGSCSCRTLEGSDDQPNSWFWVWRCRVSKEDVEYYGSCYTPGVDFWWCCDHCSEASYCN